MPCRISDNEGKFLPTTPTLSRIQCSFFFSYYELPSLTKRELECPLGEKPKFFEEPIEEEEELISPTQTMAENKHNEIFPMRATNGEAKINNISIFSLPNFHGLTSKDIISCLSLLLSIGPMTMPLMNKI